MATKISVISIDNPDKKLFIGDLFKMVEYCSALKIVDKFLSLKKDKQPMINSELTSSNDFYNSEPVYYEGVFYWLFNTGLIGRLVIPERSNFVKITSGYIAIASPYLSIPDRLIDGNSRGSIYEVKFSSALSATLLLVDAKINNYIFDLSRKITPLLVLKVGLICDLQFTVSDYIIKPYPLFKIDGDNGFDKYEKLKRYIMSNNLHGIVNSIMNEDKVADILSLSSTLPVVDSYYDDNDDNEDEDEDEDNDDGGDIF